MAEHLGFDSGIARMRVCTITRHQVYVNRFLKKNPYLSSLIRALPDSLQFEPDRLVSGAYEKYPIKTRHVILNGKLCLLGAAWKHKAKPNTYHIKSHSTKGGIEAVLYRMPDERWLVIPRDRLPKKATMFVERDRIRKGPNWQQYINAWHYLES